MMPTSSFKLQCSVARMLPFIQARRCLEPKGNLLCVFSTVSVVSGSATASHKLPSVTMTLQRPTNRTPGEMRGSKSAWAWHSELPLPTLPSFSNALIFRKKCSLLLVCKIPATFFTKCLLSESSLITCKRPLPWLYSGGIIAPNLKTEIK